MESDRIFAESLALESQQLPPTDSNLPYRPYVRNNRTTNSNSSEFDSNSSQSNPTNQVREGRDELDELSAKFEKLAQEGLIVGRELGAKAGVKLSSFFQTLKAKVDDLAQPPPPYVHFQMRCSSALT